MPLKGFYATTSGFPKYFSSMAGQIQGRKDHQEGGMAVLRTGLAHCLAALHAPSGGLCQGRWEKASQRCLRNGCSICLSCLGSEPGHGHRAGHPGS